MPRLTKSQLKRRGQLSWYNQLVKAGKLQAAADWSAKHKLFAIPPNDRSATLSPLATSSQSGELAHAAVSTQQSQSDSPLLALPRSATSLQAVYDGGAGVRQDGLAQNLDQSGLGVENPQSLPSVAGGLGGGSGGELPSATVGSAPDGAFPASPSGEVEGISGSCQPDKAHLFSNRLESGGWLVSGEGVVGGNCRNRWFVEVSVDGKWAKAAVGDVVVRRGTRVRVRLEWVSADGRDAEYAIVEALPDLAEPVQARPVGFVEQNARNVPIAKETAQEAKPVAVFQTLPPQSLGLYQTGTQTIHDQPKEVVFQTTTMEALVEAEKVGVMHVSGKVLPVRASEDFRSPVLDDVPAPIVQPQADDADFMERARRDAMKEFYGV